MEHRTSYRVRYPLGYPSALVPRVAIEPAQRVELEDWSERGLRIRVPQSMTLEVGTVLTLSITLHDEDPIAAEGTIVWRDEHSAAIQLSESMLPWRILLNEQRAIARWRTKLVEVRDDELEG